VKKPMDLNFHAEVVAMENDVISIRFIVDKDDQRNPKTLERSIKPHSLKLKKRDPLTWKA